MTVTDQIKILDKKVKQNEAQYDLDRKQHNPTHSNNTSQTSCNNFKTINASIDYILSSKIFDEPLF